MKNFTPYFLDAAPAITVASVSEIPNLDPYFQALIMIVSGFTAIIRLWKSMRNDKKDKSE